MQSVTLFSALIIASTISGSAAEPLDEIALQIGTFECNITPPLDEPIGMGFIDTPKTVEHPLLAKGVLLKDSGGMYVLCAIDWMEVHNDSYDFLREKIATAAGTTTSRVAVHCLHQHTAPAIDSTAQRIQLPRDDPRRVASLAYERDSARKIASAIQQALKRMRPVTHIGTSKAKVDRVASNRRVEQSDGTLLTRSSSTTDPVLQAAPEGVIDPWLRTLSFCRDKKPIAQIHYYATHPQSFYGDARISYDTVGIAREKLQKESGVFQVYFTGCGGDIAMGKYNDRSREARTALTNRLHGAMERSVASVQLAAASPIRWQTVPVQFPQRRDPAFMEEANRRLLADPQEKFRVHLKAAFNLAWIERVKAKRSVELSCLTIGSVQLLHLPGEPFVQYQLAAQRFQPESFVLVAGYGDCGMSYIGGDRIYTDRGGYEQSYAFSGPCEQLLLSAVDKLLAGKGVESPHQAENPLVRVVDLNLEESTMVELCDGQRVEVKLVGLQETRDPIRQAVRSSMVTVQVDGQTITLESGMYNLPQRVAGVQIDCSITKGYNSNGTPTYWGLDKDARLRLWPKESPLVKPGSLIYPVDQRWFATRTWFDNEPVDGGTTVLPKIYYHSGLDIGGSERQVKVVAATDAVVVSAGDDVLPEYLPEGGSAPKYGQGKSPVAQRYDVVYLRDDRGWYYRYSHLHKINDAIRPGRIIDQGTEIGMLGKKGASGGWSHLHFEIKCRQPSGKWGTQAGYAFLWEAYRNQHKPELVANTRRKNFLMPGGTVTLDGSKSYSATDSIQSYQWTFSDGSTATGARVVRAYDEPGFFSEILKVTDKAGNIDYDFAEVQVLDPKQPHRYVPRIHAAYWPTLGNMVNEPITFKVRSFGNQEGGEVWDFGDGSPPVKVRSDGNVDAQAKEGYAITRHTFQQSGDYVVSVQRSRNDGVTATARLHVRVEADR